MLRAHIENKTFNETELKVNPDYYIKANDELQHKVEEEELGLMAVGYYAIIKVPYAPRQIKILMNTIKILQIYIQNFLK